MQPDRPLYEEMVRQGSRGRWFWRVGGWLRLAGIAGIVLMLTMWPLVWYFRVGGTGIYFFFALLGMAALFTLGSFLRNVSYRIALGEGIDIAEYFEKEENGPGRQPRSPAR